MRPILLVSSSLMVALASPVRAQFAQPAPGVEVSRQSFASIADVRVLSDGSLLVSDAAENRVVRIVLGQEGTAEIAHAPGKAASRSRAPRLFAFGRDTTAVVDVESGEIRLLLPSLQVVSSPSFSATSPKPDGVPLGFWSRNGILYQNAMASAGNPRSDGDFAVVTLDRGASVDTIASLQLPVGERSGARVIEGGRVMLFTNRPLAARDAAVALDGRGVAVVRAAPFRVDWILMDGARITDSLDVPARIPVDSVERAAFLQSRLRAGRVVVDGNALPTFPAPEPRGLEEALGSDAEWPMYHPPFLASQVVYDPCGGIWIGLPHAANDSIQQFAVVRQRVGNVGRVAVSRGSRLVALTRSGAYYAVPSTDGRSVIRREARGDCGPD